MGVVRNRVVCIIAGLSIWAKLECGCINAVVVVDVYWQAKNMAEKARAGKLVRS